ncbi:MAG: metalloregulator ArsR/SmtB family transcription factor [Patescibacteria group bacterium]|jgi:ArsR family transcriptional regulator|nr:metalloregulator ArsR/SmtB family transcription factor [Patescibacteria group bacterium]
MEKANTSTDFIKAINDQTRFKILKYLKQECCVTDVWQKLDISQNLASFHLKVLKDLGFVTAKKQGLKVIYCVDKKKIQKAINDLENKLL